MSRLRLLLLLTGLGALLSGGPVSALVAPGPDGEPLPVAAHSAPALQLLETAAHAARTRAWRGTQQVTSTRDGEPRSTVLQLEHTPGTGSSVRVLSQSDEALAPDLLDEKLLRLLAEHYDLRVVGHGACAGRAAALVDVRRPGRQGAGALAARFWLDRATGLVLRRDLLDEAGALVRSSAFVTMTVAAAQRPAAVTAAPLVPTGEHLDDDALGALERAGWPVVRRLPSGFELFEARLHDASGGEVLQLSYSDGLSTLSLFVQEGDLPEDTAGSPRTMGAATVWVSRRTPEQVVWSGDDRTWTLVSDAPESAVEEAVMVLPHLPRPDRDEGVPAKVWRGMSRAGSWLNPFD